MQVETFEVTEVTSDGKCDTEKKEEAQKLIIDLGLEGQEGYYGLSDKTSDVVPYRKMTKDEGFIYRTLCPGRCGLSDFSESPIPLRVLQVAAHAQSLGYFTSLRVWHAENADVKDPVLVGIIGDAYFAKQIYLLARWGEVLESLEVMKEKALKIWRESTKATIQEELADLSSVMQTVDDADPFSKNFSKYYKDSGA